MSGEPSVTDKFETTPDWQIVAVVMGIIYLAYIVSGFLIGFPLRGQINAIGNLTFYVAVFAMLSLALNLHWGYTGLFNIGVVAFMAIGVYTMAVLVKQPLSQDPTAQIGGLGLPIPVGMAAGVVVATVFGLIVSLPALRLRADYLAIVTIAFSEIMRFTFLETSIKTFTLFGTETGLGGGSGLVFNVPAPIDWLTSALYVRGPYLDFVGWFGTTLGIGNPKAVVDNLVYSIILVLVVVAFYWLLQRIGRSPFGRVLKAIREDEDVARALGKDTDWFKMQSFMVGCGLMGLVGVLWMYDQGAINPNNFRPRLTFYAWIALIIGGAGSNTGSVLGGAIFAALLFQGPVYAKNLVTTAVGSGSAPQTFAGAVAPLGNLDPGPFAYYVLGNINQLQIVFMGVVLIWLMHNRPEGLLGHRSEEAAAVDLTDRPVVSDGGEVDE
ncbi:branched-chain amino acid ABC transporter permease [Halobacteriales archaeon QS_1_68_20]|nr:MAG: branched-chain amino acid ABC transporter permease [Halobacteriales archaeon QS_1_68_20]